MSAFQEAPAKELTPEEIEKQKKDKLKKVLVDFLS